MKLRSASTIQSNPSSTPPDILFNSRNKRFEAIKEELRGKLGEEGFCLLFDDFYEKIKKEEDSYTFGKWVRSLKVVEVYLLEKMFKELTAGFSFRRQPGDFEAHGAASLAAASILVLGLALEIKEVKSLYDIPPIRRRAASCVYAFVRLVLFSRTGLDVKVHYDRFKVSAPYREEELFEEGPKFQAQLREAVEKLGFVMIGSIPPPASQAPAEPSREYSEEERGVGDEAFQALMGKLRNLPDRG